MEVDNFVYNELITESSSRGQRVRQCTLCSFSRTVQKGSWLAGQKAKWDLLTHLKEYHEEEVKTHEIRFYLLRGAKHGSKA